MPDENGLVRIEHYKQFEKQGVNIKDSEMPDFPYFINYIWQWWLDMNSERPANGMSISALSSKFMYDYLEIHSIRPMTVELQILKAIDQEFIGAINGRHSKSSNKG